MCVGYKLGLSIGYHKTKSNMLPSLSTDTRSSRTTKHLPVSPRQTGKCKLVRFTSQYYVLVVSGVV